jgi:hypothetical protein
VKGSDWLISVWLFNNCQPLKWQSYFLTDVNHAHDCFWEITGVCSNFQAKLVMVRIELDKLVRALWERNILQFQIFENNYIYCTKLFVLNSCLFYFFKSFMSHPPHTQQQCIVGTQCRRLRGWNSVKGCELEGWHHIGASQQVQDILGDKA